MTRPEHLFRGSPRKDASLFIPKETIKFGVIERLVVSATPERIVATKFVVPVEGLTVKTGSFEDIHYYLCANETEFMTRDHGGAIYMLPSKSFKYVPDAGTGIWASLKPVEPISKEEVPSGLDAMIDAGVQVYFVGPEIFNEFMQLESPAARIKMLRQIVSENTRKNRNVRALPKFGID